MIRVIYRWNVQPENFEKFKQAWSVATNRIHETIDGARGSLMLRADEDSSVVLTIARWDSIEAWKSFWQGLPPSEMERMRELGDFLSSEAYNEIDDFTR